MLRDTRLSPPARGLGPLASRRRGTCLGTSVSGVGGILGILISSEAYQLKLVNKVFINKTVINSDCLSKELSIVG